jgi:disulfide bond formation protein DsbB
MHAPVKPRTATLSPFGIAAVIFLIAAATIAGAWAFQWAGYPPCDLCLKERFAYYVGVPLAALVALGAARGGPRPLLMAGFALLALIFVANAVLGGYHAGIEWKIWPGPTDCTGPLRPAESMNDFLKSLDTAKVVRCDAAALRILGISLAGWNAVISLCLSIASAIGFSRARKSP